MYAFITITVLDKCLLNVVDNMAVAVSFLLFLRIV